MLFKGDIGAKIVLDTSINITTGTVFKIYYRKPDGTTGSWTAAKESDNQSISYTTVAGTDLNVVGTWILQSYVEIASYKGYGQEVELLVKEKTTEIYTAALTSLGAVKGFLKIPATTTEDDTLLQSLITRMSADIEKECGRIFVSATYTEYYSGDGTSKLALNQFPITSITSIHDDVDRDYDAGSLVSSDDYSFDANSGIVELDGLTFCKGVKNVKVVYLAGYAAAPADLEQACIKRVAIEYILASAGINAFDSDNIAKLDKMKDSAKETIDRYKGIV